MAKHGKIQVPRKKSSSHNSGHKKMPRKGGKKK